jgi:eukaryotic translation initiation factor 2C
MFASAGTNIDIADPMRLAQWLMPKRAMIGGQPRYEMSEPFKLLRRFARLKFRVQHRGKTTDTKIYTIKGFCFSADPNKYGDEGGNPKRVTFVHKQSGEPRSVFDHYYKTYNIHLKYWQLPCIESSKGGFFPPESCHLVEMQKYNFKLDPIQTAEMIKFAVTRPPQRRQDIMAAAQRVAWDKDKFLSDFGFKVDCNFAKTKAKLIKNPEIQFGGNAKLNPGMTGRWDLRGKKFFKPNSEPLTSWAFVVTDGCVDKQTLDNFVRAFKQAYQGHGGRIANDPMLHNLDRGLSQNLVVEQSYKATGNNFRKTPQILFYILPKKEAWLYERLKKSLDCRYGVVSQMLNVSHVRKAAPQYCSNVCMKVNAKLQGATCRIPGPTPTQSAFFKRPTIMIGADVGHPAHGSAQASMAAMTMSMDRDAAVYHAKCETNGFRVEIIQPQTIYSILRPMLQNWSKAMPGAKPEHVFYFRDGVSEGEFAQVMEIEVKEIRRNIKETFGTDAKITVIIATKRHHVRFFPEKGDKNGNPLPGTLVEREVTHPFHYDFYLCSHVAIQGTARPVHYHVLHDEIKMEPDELQKMIYHQCYAYQRATTPVSLHPAVYYAHIAGQRARAHEDQASSERMPEREQPQRDPRKIYKDSDPYADSSIRKGAETKPLLPLGGGGDAREESKNFIRNTMWFI